MNRPVLFPLAFLFVPLASALPQGVTSSITAEGTEIVRVSPDEARVVATAVSINADSGLASDDAIERADRFTERVQLLKTKGLKVTADPVTLTRLTNLNGPGRPRAEVIRASRTVAVTISDADPKRLAALVTSIQQEAIKEGLTGPPSDTELLPGGGSAEAMRVTFSRRTPVEEQSAAALTKATRKATARAEAIASGLGMKLGQVLAAEEVLPAPDSTTGAAASGELVEGELVLTVRVRVVFSAVK